jgi:hypothetical protein
VAEDLVSILLKYDDRILDLFFPILPPRHRKSIQGLALKRREQTAYKRARFAEQERQIRASSTATNSLIPTIDKTYEKFKLDTELTKEEEERLRERLVGEDHGQKHIDKTKEDVRANPYVKKAQEEMLAAAASKTGEKKNYEGGRPTKRAKGILENGMMEIEFSRTSVAKTAAAADLRVDDDGLDSGFEEARLLQQTQGEEEDEDTSNFTCFSCISPPVYPVSSKCRHVGCTACWVRWKKSLGEKGLPFKCPVCSSLLDWKDMHNMKIVKGGRKEVGGKKPVLKTTQKEEQDNDDDDDDDLLVVS